MSTDQTVIVARAVCVIAFTLAAAIVDWRFKRIPNKLTVAAFAIGLLFNLVAGAVTGGAIGAGQGLAWALLGFAVGFGMLLVLWLVGSGGGGDVKYMGALGAWLGPYMTFQVFVIGALITVVGSVLTLVGEALRIGIGRTKARYVSAKAGKIKGSAEVVEQVRQQALVRRRLMPWAVPAGIAAWIVLAWTMLRG